MNNIHFSFKELDIPKSGLNDAEINLQQMIEQLDKDHKNKKKIHYLQTMFPLQPLNNSTMHNPATTTTPMHSVNLELTEKLTVKSLLKICDYYNIEKDIKVTKCKKQDILAAILDFESSPDNAEIVKCRYKLWSCMEILLNDNKMKKYILWP
jgi:hypothetical protein